VATLIALRTGTACEGDATAILDPLALLAPLQCALMIRAVSMERFDAST
jgi:hypothetical protein